MKIVSERGVFDYRITDRKYKHMSEYDDPIFGQTEIAAHKNKVTDIFMDKDCRLYSSPQSDIAVLVADGETLQLNRVKSEAVPLN